MAVVRDHPRNGGQIPVGKVGEQRRQRDDVVRLSVLVDGVEGRRGFQIPGTLAFCG